MTINSEIRRAGPFVGNGVTAEFPFDFKVFKAEDLYVVVAPEDGVGELPLRLGTDYTVILNPDQDANPGGTIVSPNPLPVGFTLTATSALEYLQPVDLTNQGGFYPAVINDGLDRLTILMQQLSERLGRALVFPLSDGQVGEVPGVGRRAGAVLAFDEDGAPIVGPSITDVDTVVGAVQAIGAVADNIEDVNTVADNVGDVTFIAAVYYGPSAEDPATRRDGSPLHEGDMYFNTADNHLRAFDGLTWGDTAAGSVATFEFTGDGEGTEFELGVSPRTKSNTQVYFDGVYQAKDNYNLVGEQGKLLAFNDPPPAGVHIEVVVMSPLPISPLSTEELVELQGLIGTAVRKDSDSDTGAALLPGGGQAQRPTSPSNGMFRYNSEKHQFEGYQNGKWGQLGGSDHVLSIKWETSRSNIGDGFAALDGQLLSRETYPDAWAAIAAGKVPVISDAEWIASPDRRGSFSTGDGSTTFRMPDYNGKSAGSLGAVFLRGDGLMAGLPGRVQLDGFKEHKHLSGMKYVNSTMGNAAYGSVIDGELSALGYSFAGSSAASQGRPYVSPEGGAETRPLNVAGVWVVKLFGAVVNVGSADAAQLASDYANLASQVQQLETGKLDADKALGVGQTWQNVLDSRANETNYTNTTGRTIAVYIYFGVGAASIHDAILVDGVTVGFASAQGGASSCFLVPPGSVYRVNTSRSVTRWSEMR